MATKPRVRFVVQKEKRDFSSDTVVINIDAVHMVEPDQSTFMGKPDEGVRNGSGNDARFEPAVAAIANLRIRAQMSPDMQDGQFYGFDVRYADCYSVDVHWAKVMVSTLTKLERHFDKLNDRFGYPTDYAGYAARVADFFGCETRCFGVRRDEMGPDGSFWRWFDVDGLRTWLRDETGAK